MALYAIADLHLSTTVDKPMDVFGGAWVGYMDKIRRGLSVLRPEDTLVIAGDISWGLRLSEALGDFRLLDSYPGRKLLVKGNHDLWWDTVRKMRGFLADNGIENMDFIHNNCFMYEDTALCGTRGWFYEEERGNRARGAGGAGSAEDAHDAKLLAREVCRLRMSLDAARAAGAARMYAFIHYPPIFGSYECEPITAMLSQYGVDTCFYGHLHGESCRLAFEGMKNGVKYRILSGDVVDFQPIRI